MTKKYKGILATLISLSIGFTTAVTNDCGGEERWEEKVLTDDESSGIDYNNPIETTIQELVTFPTGKSSSKKPRQQIELSAYTIECNISKYILEDDEDLHLVLEDGGASMIGEIPDFRCPEADESNFTTRYKNARVMFSKYIKDKKYQTMRWRVTGVGFVDFAHGQTGKADNNVELHPILKLEPF